MALTRSKPAKSPTPPYTRSPLQQRSNLDPIRLFIEGAGRLRPLSDPCGRIPADVPPRQFFAFEVEICHRRSPPSKDARITPDALLVREGDFDATTHGSRTRVGIRSADWHSARGKQIGPD